MSGRESAQIFDFPVVSGSVRWRALNRETFRDRWSEDLIKLGAPTSIVAFGDAFAVCAEYAAGSALNPAGECPLEDLADRIGAAMDRHAGTSDPCHVRLPLASPKTEGNPIPLAFGGIDALSLLITSAAVRDEILRLSFEDAEERTPFAQILIQPDRHYAPASSTRVFVTNGQILGHWPRASAWPVKAASDAAWDEDVSRFVTKDVAPACHLARFAADVCWSGVRRGPELVALQAWGACATLGFTSFAAILAAAAA